MHTLTLALAYASPALVTLAAMLGVLTIRDLRR